MCIMFKSFVICIKKFNKQEYSGTYQVASYFGLKQNAQFFYYYNLVAFQEQLL